MGTYTFKKDESTGLVMRYRNDELQESALNSELQLLSQIDELEGALTEISNMCVGDVTMRYMRYKLDAAAIGELIYRATGKTNEKLNADNT